MKNKLDKTVFKILRYLNAEDIPVLVNGCQ